MAAGASPLPSQQLPLGARVHLGVKSDKEIVGTLQDELVSMLEDVTEFEITPEGRRITKLDQIL
uniref:Uncharacterized protein n=1 Tax=Otus sunia TaxID=257818 RepID=A0A8C8B750_9STRI